MTITIHLSPEQERRLSGRAAQNGQDLVGYIHRLIERDLRSPTTADEALGPFRRQVEASGMTDDELDNFFEGAREEVWQEKQGPG